MVPIDLYLGFIAATLILCIIPGPVVTWLVATGIRFGPRASLTGLAGTTCALSLHMVLTVLGLAQLLAALGPWTEALKLVGAAYLVWLGIQSWRAPYDPMDENSGPSSRPTTDLLLRRGFLISVTNPKTLAFYAAFFPQFVSPDTSATPQLIILAVTFIAVSTISDGAYAIGAGALAPWLTSRRAQTIRNKASGAVLALAGLGLALTRR
ncbi:MAG: LysE family translocator [Nitratireductor sp.]